jgi:hypothetical protein
MPTTPLPRHFYSAVFPLFFSEHNEQSLDCWFVTGTLGRMQSTQGTKQMDHAHFPKSVMAWAARNEMEPTAPKNKDPAANEPCSRHAIDSPWR